MQLKHLLPRQLQDAIRRDLPLLVPAGCVECHGMHAALGLDTLVAEAVCQAIAARLPAVIAPTFEYGPTGWAVSGPELGTVDVDGNAFYLHVKDVLRSFLLMGWQRVVVIIHHQGMDGPEALAFRKAAADLAFELMREQHGPGWWGDHPPETYGRVWDRVRVAPTILPHAAPMGPGDHAGHTETSLLMHLHPELVDLGQLAQRSFWYTDQPGDQASSGTAEDGRRYFEAMVEAWVRELGG
jgi:creatinine amidohydrolase